MSYQMILWLICTPGLELTFQPEADPISWYNLKQVAQDLELWPAEGNWNHNFASEIKWVRMRWEEYADAPLVSDAERFPKLEVIDGWLDFAYQRRDYLQERRDNCVNAYQMFEALHADQTWRINCLLCMKQARHGKERDKLIDYQSTRSALRALRDWYLGPERYFVGDWPSHVMLDSFYK